MRFPPDHKAKTREMILRSAAKLFRRDGYHATGVDKVMAEAGLTAGGFYAHFGSKAELLAEAILYAGRHSDLVREVDETGLTGLDWVGEFARVYLSPSHRDRPDEGCALPALSPEAGRCDELVKKSIGLLVQGLARRVREHLPPDDGDKAGADTGLVIVALVVGAQVLARGVGRGKLSDRLLAAVRAHLAELLAGPPGPG